MPRIFTDTELDQLIRESRLSESSPAGVKGAMKPAAGRSLVNGSHPFNRLKDAELLRIIVGKQTSPDGGPEEAALALGRVVQSKMDASVDRGDKSPLRFLVSILGWSLSVMLRARVTPSELQQALNALPPV